MALADSAWSPPEACNGALEERVHAVHVQQGHGQAYVRAARWMQGLLETGVTHETHRAPGGHPVRATPARLPGGPCPPSHRGKQPRESIAEWNSVRYHTVSHRVVGTRLPTAMDRAARVMLRPKRERVLARFTPRAPVPGGVYSSSLWPPFSRRGVSVRAVFLCTACGSPHQEPLFMTRRSRMA